MEAPGCRAYVSLRQAAYTHPPTHEKAASPPAGQAPPWGSWLRSRLRGERCFVKIVSVKMWHFTFSTFPSLPSHRCRGALPEGEPPDQR